MYMDLRYVLIYVMNLMKSEHLKWDVFGVVTKPTWLKITLVLLLSIFISYFSLPFSRSFPLIPVRPPHKFSPVMFICFVGALILPQLLFWYFYLTVFFFYWTRHCAAAVFTTSVQSLQAFFSRSPAFDMGFTTANYAAADLEAQTPVAAITPADASEDQI